MSSETSYPREKINILLLERINESAVKKLERAGYNVQTVPKSLAEAELVQEIRNCHVLGIRSKTKVSAEVLAAAERLMVIGCFGVGTNQVALEQATNQGVPVFNAPYSSTRSVAELAVADLVMLARKAADKNCQMHRGLWDKSASGMKEVRGKTIGIVGYGHIGAQVGLLAEAFGLKVIYFDLMPRLPLGNAAVVDSIDELLAQADFVSLHVPAGPQGRALIGENELRKMKPGSYLLNLSRGSLVDLNALKSALQSKHLAGAALDVYADEPRTNQADFRCELAGVENVIMTPHLGGSTEEAQHNIGVEVATSFIKFIDNGSTIGATNFPQVNLPAFPESHRILNVHKNEPGVLSDVNKIVSNLGVNINAQYLSTYKNIGYLIMDVNKSVSEELRKELALLPNSIKTRILY